MSKTFAAFARSGNPNIEGVPHWPTYDPVKRETFIYDIPPKVISDPNKEYRLYWAGLGKASEKTTDPADSPLKDVMGGKKFEYTEKQIGRASCRERVCKNG